MLQHVKFHRNPCTTVFKIAYPAHRHDRQTNIQNKNIIFHNEVVTDLSVISLNIEKSFFCDTNYTKWRRCGCTGERISRVTGVVKQLVLDVAELHDVRRQRQQRRNQVPAGRTSSISESTRTDIGGVVSDKWSDMLERVFARRSEDTSDIM